MGTLLDLVNIHYRGLATHDLDLSMTVFADDVVTETPSGVLEGIEAFRAFGEGFLAAVPDMSHTMRAHWEVGDTIIVEGTYSGTHTGPLVAPDGSEIPPTGRAFSFPYVDVLVARDGRFVEHRVYWDNVAFFSQLGLMPEPATA
jgi:predicted ester cyclase